MVLTFSLLVLLFNFPQEGMASILISTVAQVKSHVITSREVEIHQILKKEIPEPFKDLNVTKPEEEVIREWLLYFEASTFYNAKVSNDKVNEYIRRVQQNLSSNKDWIRLSVSSQELQNKLSRVLESERLYVFKKKASNLPVSPAEVETEYTQNRIRYGDKTFSDVKEEIRNNKVDENLKARMEQWFQVLEKKYKVQRFSKYHSL